MKKLTIIMAVSILTLGLVGVAAQAEGTSNSPDSTIDKTNTKIDRDGGKMNRETDPEGASEYDTENSEMEQMAEGTIVNVDEKNKVVTVEKEDGDIVHYALAKNAKTYKGDKSISLKKLKKGEKVSLDTNDSNQVEEIRIAE